LTIATALNTVQPIEDNNGACQNADG